MTLTERDELDSNVMAAIRGGACRLDTIAAQLGLQHWQDMRTVDRSLQRLRKAGRIQYDAGTGWKEGGT